MSTQTPEPQAHHTLAEFILTPHLAQHLLRFGSIPDLHRLQINKEMRAKYMHLLHDRMKKSKPLERIMMAYQPYISRIGNIQHPFHIRNTARSYEFQTLYPNNLYRSINSNLTDLTLFMLPEGEILQHCASMTVSCDMGCCMINLSVDNFQPIQQHIRELDNKSQIPPNAEPYHLIRTFDLFAILTYNNKHWVAQFNLRKWTDNLGATRRTYGFTFPRGTQEHTQIVELFYTIASLAFPDVRPDTRLLAIQTEPVPLEATNAGQGGAMS